MSAIKQHKRLKVTIKKGSNKQYSWNSKSGADIVSTGGEQYHNLSDAHGGLCAATVAQFTYIVARKDASPFKEAYAEIEGIISECGC